MRLLNIELGDRVIPLDEESMNWEDADSVVCESHPKFSEAYQQDPENKRTVKEAA
jgi:hypothetical protein